MLAGTRAFFGNMDSLIYLSASFGLLAFIEMEIQWDRKLRITELKSLLHERHHISIPGKVAGYASTATLAAYFCYKLFG